MAVTTVSVIGGDLGYHNVPVLGAESFDTNLPVPNTVVALDLTDPIPFVYAGVDGVATALVASNPAAPAVQVLLGAGGDTILNTVIGAGGNLPVVTTLPDGTSPVQFAYLGVPSVGAVGVAINQETQAIQIFGGPSGAETTLNTVIGANSLPAVVTLPDGSSPVQFGYIGVPGVGYAGIAVNQDAGPGDPFIQVLAGDTDPSTGDINFLLHMPDGGLPSSSSSSSSDSLTFGSGLDSVASLGNATAAGLSGSVASLGVDSIVSTVADAVPVAGASDLFSAQSSSSAFALGADSLSAVQVVGDFASTPVAAATDVVTTVADTAGSVVSLDSGLTTIQVTGLTNKLGGH